MEEVIQAKGLSKRFGELLAVDQVDFSVRAGEVFGFLGPNGAGKTTTIRMLVGLSRPTSGEAWVNGFSVLTEAPRVKETLGVVPEASNLYGELTAEENLVYLAQLYGLPRRQWRERAGDLLKEFGLPEKKDARFQGLSRGMKRRLTIAAALVHRPRLLFLDEPTTGLDVMSARGLRQVVRDLKKRGVTVFLTTHLIPEAEDLCDRVAVLVRGKIRAIDTPENLINQARERGGLEIKPGSIPDVLLKELESLPEVEKAGRIADRIHLWGPSVHQALPAIIGRLQEGNIPILAIRTLTPTLEDAFVRLTGLEAEIMRVDKPQKAGGMAQ